MELLKKSIFTFLILFSMLSAFPKVGDKAVDFTIYSYKEQKDVTISVNQGKVIALISGSYTWPPYRKNASVRQQIFDKFKGHPDFEMYDVYCSEAHAGQNMEGMDFTKIKQPKQFDERVALYEKYIQDENVNYPGLIDKIDNSWKKHNTYKSFYTSIWVIDREGKFAYTVFFAHPTYPSGDPNAYINLDKKLIEMLPTSIASQNKTSKIAKPELVKSSNNTYTLSHDGISQGKLSIVNTSGRSVYQKSYSKEITFKKPVTPGYYIVKIESTKGQFNLPLVVQ